MDDPLPPIRRQPLPFLLQLGLLLLLAGSSAAFGILAFRQANQDHDALVKAQTLAALATASHASSGKTPSLPDGSSVRLFSLTPLSPANQASGFEADALQAFRQDQAFYQDSANIDGTLRYRYAQPLSVGQDCLACHASQDFILGERRGGVSVSWPLPGSTASPTWNGLGLVLAALAALGCLVALPVLAASRTALLRRRYEEELSVMKTTDDLTGLAKRNYFVQRYEEEFARAIRHGRALSVIMIDIDHFRSLNDFYGHALGDRCLELLASILKSNCRRSDLPARLGAEEFAILLPEIGAEGAQIHAEKLRSIVASAFIPLSETEQARIPARGDEAIASGRHGRKGMRFTISLGIASRSGAALENLNPRFELVNLADTALAQAKRSGRNRVVLHP